MIRMAWENRIPYQFATATVCKFTIESVDFFYGNLTAEFVQGQACDKQADFLFDFNPIIGIGTFYDMAEKEAFFGHIFPCAGAISQNPANSAL